MSNLSVEKRVCEALLEIQQAVRSIDSEQAHRSVADKYGVLFLGPGKNEASDAEVANSLGDYFDLDVSLDDFLAMLPRLSAAIGIGLNRKVELKDVGKKDAKVRYLISF